MDIVIKGMEMPKNCNRCKLATHYFTNTHKVRCFINAEMREADGIDSRPKWCPLVALPEHGDLIDRNELPIIGITDYKLESHTVVEFEDVLNAPVIVEASE